MHVVVLGGGSSGEHFVGAMRRLDPECELTLVESRLVGGECSYWACMPTKTMLRPLEVHAAAGRTPGVSGAGELDPEGIFSWRDAVAERDDSSQVTFLQANRCKLVRGVGRVVSPGVVMVDDEEIPYDALVIATGSRPFVPEIRGLDTVEYWTNVEATEATELPGSLLVIGGGPAGCEFSQFYARLGCEVTLVQDDERLLPTIDAEASDAVASALRDDGVTVRTHADISRIDPGSVQLGSGQRYSFDRLLLATGRQSNLEGLEGLELRTHARGIAVDERLRAAPGVWAIGDVTGISRLTHLGKYHARIAAFDIAGYEVAADHRAVPQVIFTDPQVALVGSMGERIVGTVSARVALRAVPRLATYERPQREGFIKIAGNAPTRTIMGAVAVGPESGEWLQQLTLAIRALVPIEMLLDVIQPYPSFSEGIFLALRDLAMKMG